MKKKVLYGVLCFLLFCLLGGFLVYCRNEEKQQIDANKQLRESLAGIENSVEEKSEEIPESTAEEASNVQTEGAVSETDKNGDETVSAASVEETTPLISIRGDAFQKEDKVQEAGIGAELKKLLEDKQITAEVQDYSLYQAGSMAQLRLAGVDEDKIDSYLKRHTDNEDDLQLSIYETKVRTAEDMELERDDQQGIPVICMGYYGGWYNDPEELNRQFQDILDTYAQKECYVIAGLYPDVDVDKEQYKQIMSETWGEHYIQLDESITHSPSQKTGRKEIAEAIFEKLQDLGYVKAEE